MDERQEKITKMEHWLQTTCPDCILIPAYKSDGEKAKQPIISHKDKTTEELWSEWHEKWRHRVMSNDLSDVLIILRAGLIVIDVDDASLATELEDRFVSMRTTAIQKTRKGRHYFFQRSPACEELPLYDKSQGLVDAEGRTLPIDIKTVCSTKTGGLISIYPSRNKEWLRAPYDYPPIVLPEDIFEWIKTHRKCSQILPLGQNLKAEFDGPLAEYDMESMTSGFTSITTGSTNTSLQRRHPYLFEIEPDVLQDIVMSCLSTARADEYSDWIAVGMALKSAGESNYALWVKFSERSTKFVGENECKAKWDSFAASAAGPSPSSGEGRERGQRSVATILAMAKRDNKDKYNAAMANTLNSMVLNSTSKSDIGRVAHKLFGATHVCVSVPKAWYVFEGHRWTLDTEGSYMWRRIREDLRQVYLAMAKQQQCIAEVSEDIKGPTQNVKTMNKIAQGLGETHVKKAVLYESAQFMSEGAKQFNDSLDTACNLLGFGNGVYDLDAGVFRDGKPEDRVTMSCGYDFADRDDPAIQADIRAFVESTQATAEMAEYLWRVMAYMLHGRKYLELMWFWTGKRGRNGKGTLVTLMSYAFGDYFYAPDAGIFMSSLADKNTAGARPDIAEMKGKRVVMASEPDDVGSSFKVNKLKGWRGNDVISARSLYQKMSSFRPQFGIVISMNDKPSLDKVDNAIAQTLRIVDFPHEFVSEPKEAHHRRIDTTLKAKFERLPYRQQFMRMLIREYRENYGALYGVGAAIPTPEEVMMSTRSYIEDNDVVGDWLNGYYEKTSNPKEYVIFMELYNAFKSDTNTRDYKQRMFSAALDAHLGPPSSLNGKRTYRCLRRKTETGDDLESQILPANSAVGRI
jgi:P4 family phage/plasmid primase-like protien